MVRNSERSLYPGFVIPREFVKSLLGRIQGTRHLVRYTGKFVIPGFVISGFQCTMDQKKYKKVFLTQIDPTLYDKQANFKVHPNVRFGTVETS